MRKKIKSSGSRVICGRHLQVIFIVFFDESVKSVSPLIKAFVNSSTFWNCKGQNVRPVIERYLVDLLKSSENIFGFPTVAQVIGATEDDYPIIFVLGGVFTFPMFRQGIFNKWARK